MQLLYSNSQSSDATAFPASGKVEDQLRFLLGYASLAPSGHNTQPWQFRIGETCADILADRTRCLPVVDPHDRELTISCGAAIGFFEIAARYFNLNTNVMLSPDIGEPDLLARIQITDGPPPLSDEVALFKAIPDRHTNRTTFSMESLPADIINTCRTLCERYAVEFDTYATKTDREAIAKLVAEGDRLQFDDPRFRRELAAWIHSARLGSHDGMSGSGFGFPDALSPLGSLVIRTFDLGDGIAAADERKIMSGSPVLALFGSASDDVVEWLNTGRALAHVLLFLTSRGLSASYLNQPIETEGLRPKLKTAAAIGALPQILIRIGFAKAKSTQSVRRELKELVVD